VETKDTTEQTKEVEYEVEKKNGQTNTIRSSVGELISVLAVLGIAAYLIFFV
jgi:hypothetical protein